MKRKIIALSLAIFFLASFGLGYIWGIESGVESYEVVADKFMERLQRSYPKLTSFNCPDDIQVEGYAYEDLIHIVNGRGTLIKDTFTLEISGTGSMLPFLTKGNSLIVERYDDRKLEVGMLVVTKPFYSSSIDFQENGIIHRIVGIDNENKLLILKGDNNVQCEQVTFDQIDYLVRGVAF